MVMPTQFYVPWAQVDPDLKHGGIPDELAVGWVAPDLGDNKFTTNRDIQNITWMLSQVAASISMHPEAESEAFPGRRLVEEAIKGMDTITERVVDVTHTHATKFFSFTHAVPPVSAFKLNAIRYPVRNQFADDFIHYCIGTMVELAENNRNAVHQGLDPTAANIIMEPLYNWKATVMKYWFDKEVAGEISAEELNTLYAGIGKPKPSYPDTTAETPSEADTAAALTGLDVLAWFPTASDWTKFAELQVRRYTPERVLQPEGARQTTEDVRFEQGHNADGTVSTGGPSI